MVRIPGAFSQWKKLMNIVLQAYVMVAMPSCTFIKHTGAECLVIF